MITRGSLTRAPAYSGADTSSTSERVPLSMAYIDITVATRWNHNWQLEGVEPTGVTMIVLSSPEEDELDDDDLSVFLH
jgi:hypothetical protein